MKLPLLRMVLVCLCSTCHHAVAQNSVVRWSSLDMGFGISVAGNTQAITAIGQSFVSVTKGETTVIQSGFFADSLLRGMVTRVAEDPHLPFPATYQLNQNYPNPFNPSTTIRYTLPRASHVTLSVYNILGQEVAMLVQEAQEAGYHTVQFAPSDLASGVYFYRLYARPTDGVQGGEFSAVKKLVVLK